jgi:hypothetical protein
MKLNPKIQHREKSISIRFLLPALAMIAGLSAFSAPVETTGEQPKTHTLFMGADISVQRDKEFYRVVDVSHGFFVINVNGERTLISPKNGPLNMRIAPGLRLTEISASIANLKSEKAYTPGNDPNQQLAKSLASAEELTDSYQSSFNVASDVKNGIDMKYSNFQPDPLNPLQGAAVRQAKETSTANLVAASAAPGSRFDTLGVTGEGEYDALEVSFEISARTALNNPYVVLIARYHTKDNKPGTAQNWVYALSLNPTGPEPRKVHVKQGGFPPGFEVEDVQVHVYNEGTEVATNVSAKRVPLTREEAFQYVMFEYVGSHKDATLPAVPVMGHLPADLPARLAEGQFNQTIYVKVSKGGMAGEAYFDESCSRKIDDSYLLSVVKAIRFNPALDRGKPVDGIAPLRLSQLPM